jgi:hypothetical protein
VDYYEVYVLHNVSRATLNQAIGTAMQTAVGKDPELYEITMEVVRQLLLPDGSYNLREQAGTPVSAATPTGTGKITVLSRNDPAIEERQQYLIGQRADILAQ